MTKLCSSKLVSLKNVWQNDVLKGHKHKPLIIALELRTEVVYSLSRSCMFTLNAHYYNGCGVSIKPSLTELVWETKRVMYHHHELVDRYDMTVSQFKNDISSKYQIFKYQNSRLIWNLTDCVTYGSIHLHWVCIHMAIDTCIARLTIRYFFVSYLFDLNIGWLLSDWLIHYASL